MTENLASASITDVTSDRPVLTVPEVAATFRVSTESVLRWAKQRKLPGFQTPGGQWRFHRDDVEAFFKTEPAA